MFPLNNDQIQEAIKRLGIVDVTTATIRQICSLAAVLEQMAEEKFVHLEIGNPGLEAAGIGVEAECKALQGGIANKYPAIDGLPVLKESGSKFVKAFLDVDMAPKSIIPTVGSMQGSYTMMTLLKMRDPKKDTMLFLQPGFPAQPNQAKIIGLKMEQFDIYEYRGKALEAKLEGYLSKGNITGLIYSNPNNPAWTNLTDEELEIIGRLSMKYDVIVMEDLAYMGMDFRRNFGEPYEAPFVPTVAKYTDNYVLLMSASKIFSYAGQRIALVGICDKLYNRHFQALSDFFEMPTFGDAYVYGILYTASSGTAHSAQYAMAAMLEAAVEDKLDFVADSREYGRRAEIVKRHFTDNGFHIVYSLDGGEPISDGFFFTAGYKNMTSAELQLELMRYGVSSISLPSTGSEQNGVRVCVSMISDDATMDQLAKRLKAFDDDHKS